MQFKYNTVNPNDPEYEKLEKYMDMAKDLVLSNSTEPITSNNNIQRFNLVPLYQHMQLDKVLQQALNVLYYVDRNMDTSRSRVHGGFTSPELDRISKKFSEKNIGLYVMIRITRNQIEYDMRPLLIRKEAEKFVIQDNSGITDRMIEKFDIVKNIDEQVDHDSVNIRMGDIKSNKWVIIRTFNGVHYDIMGTDKKTLFVNTALIDKLDRGPSERIRNYHSICVDKIMSFVKTPKEIILEKQITPLQGITNKVIRSVILFIDKKLEKSPSSLSELSTYVSGNDIEEIASKILIASFSSIGTKKISELSSTFLYSIDGVIKNFTRSIREGFAKSDMNEFMFKEKTKESLIIHIRKRMGEIVQLAADKVFDPKQDIYERVLVKKKLLNIEL